MLNKRAQDNLNLFIFKFKRATRIFVELWLGLKNDTIPHEKCGGWLFIVGVTVYTHLDYKLFKLLKKEHLYPENHPYIYWSNVFVIALLGYLGWAAFRVQARRMYFDQLTKIFSDLGLVTVTKRLPAFVSDREIDAHYHVMTLFKNGLSVKDFLLVKDKLSEALHCFIEEIREARKEGLIEILYSRKDFDKIVDLDSPNSFPNYSFTIGNTRLGKQVKNLSDVPHFLIAGTSNQGKSTFLRQFITTLYLNNMSMNFTLIDLKSGLESICFRDLPRVDCVTEANKAIKALEKLEGLIKTRAQILLANNCEKIEEFFKIPVDQRKYPNNMLDKNLTRHLIVIDEAAELFLAGQHLSSDSAVKSRRIVQTIAAQGRAVGLHIVVSTQRPDYKIVDMAIKTNLQGRICFYMADNASSMTILDSGRASDLPNLPGRAIWKNGNEIFEIQAPMLSKDAANQVLDNLRVKKAEEAKQIIAPNVTEANEEVDLEKDA
ncbi:MAG: hypothetical protein A4S09_03320 [Proteobacteria bacterium SG_bin7]|nr:MAG: hypothetical protein A4S09_03320 [Proteobacteria bacterium SG_bin7]